MQTKKSPLALSLVLLSLAAGCTGGSPEIGSDAGAEAEEWPKQVVLTHEWTVDALAGLRFSDGTIGPPESSDIHLIQGRLLSLVGDEPMTACEKGVYVALDQVPTSVESCPAGRDPNGLTSGWDRGFALSATSIHATEESYRVGVGALVWDRAHTTLYRLRTLGDSYAATGVATATFEYEPVVAQPRCR